METGSRKGLGTLRGSVLITLILLVAQYVLGMATNLYVQFPSTLQDGNAWGWGMGQSTLIRTHVILGSVLVLMSLLTVIFAIVARRGLSIILNLLGLLSVVFAWMGGLTFLSSGQQNGASLNMSIGFILAIVFFAIDYYTSRRRG